MPLYSDYKIVANECEIKSRGEETQTEVSDVIIKNNQVVDGFYELVHFSSVELILSFIGLTRKEYQDSKFYQQKHSS